MGYGKFPGYIRFMYETEKALHSMDLCTRSPEENIGGGIFYNSWNGINTVLFEDMVQGLVEALVPSFPTSTTFLDATAYRVLEEGSDAAVPVDFHVITDGAGTNANPGIDAAQATWSFLDAEGKRSQLVGLDITPSAEYRPRRPGGFVAADTTLEAEWTSVLVAWSSRAGNRPSALRRVVFTLNDALRKAYRYT